MPRFEYKVVPAPAKGLKGKGVKGAEARFSHALQELMNGMADDGWEYQRAETLPSIERAGLTGTTTEWRNVLVFRRPHDDDAEAFAPELLPAPAAVTPAPADATPAMNANPEPDQMTKNLAAKPDQPLDNGAEDSGEFGDLGPSLSKLAASRNSHKSDS